VADREGEGFGSVCEKKKIIMGHGIGERGLGLGNKL